MMGYGSVSVTVHKDDKERARAYLATRGFCTTTERRGPDHVQINISVTLDFPDNPHMLIDVTPS